MTSFARAYRDIRGAAANPPESGAVFARRHAARRTLAIAVLCVFIMSSAMASTFGGELVRVHTFPGTGWSGHTISDAQGFGAALDSEGNAYISGSFRRDMPGSYEGTHPTNGRNASVAKVAPSGVVIWSRHFHATHLAEVLGIEVDPAGNVYLAGYVIGEVDADPRPEAEAVIGSSNGAHAFVIKLDSNGDLLWSANVGGRGLSAASDIAVDVHGNVFVTGIFITSADFDPGDGEFEQDTEGSQDGFLLKLNSDGEFDWVRTITGPGSHELSGVSVDMDGAVYVAGKIAGTVGFGPGPDAPTIPGTGGSGLLILKATPGGDLEWAHAVGGSLSALGRAIAVSGAGDVRVSGHFAGNGGNNSSGEDFPGAGAPESGAFVSRLTSDGDFLWTQHVAWATTSFHGLAVDGDGNCYLAAENLREIDFLTGDPAHELDFGSRRKAYLVKYSADGSFKWVRVVDSEGPSYGNAVAANEAGEVIFTGSFETAARFVSGDSPPVYTAQGGGDEDAFMLRFAAPEPVFVYDITGSGTVNAVDVQIVINAALGIEVGYNADVTGNGKVDAVDVQRVINAALGIPNG